MSGIVLIAKVTLDLKKSDLDFKTLKPILGYSDLFVNVNSFIK